jgi:hypothetical protein
VATCAVLTSCAALQNYKSFESPEAAVEAFVAALEANDLPALRGMLGPDAEGLLESGDSLQDKDDRSAFVAAYRARHSLDTDGDDRRVLVVGAKDWPFPVPIVKRGGRWHLDGKESVDELIYRRVGANELGAIRVCRGCVDAQLEYAAAGHDGDPAGIYALKLISDPGLHNGLYWESAGGEVESPVGPFIANAAAEGYRSVKGHPYHGYVYQMLYRQGAHAKGGVREYFADGLLTGGFSLVARPAEYGVSGVMTFLVNQDGIVYQKDLGEDTAATVKAMDTFDPDDSWTEVPVESVPDS